jgi:hypothetical protein
MRRVGQAESCQGAPTEARQGVFCQSLKARNFAPRRARADPNADLES